MYNLPVSFNRLTEWLRKGGVDNLYKVKDISINANGLELEIKLENNLTMYINTHSIDDSECNIYLVYQGNNGKEYFLSRETDWGYLTELNNEFKDLKDVILSLLNGSLQRLHENFQFVLRQTNFGKVIETLPYDLVMKGGK